MTIPEMSQKKFNLEVEINKLLMAFMNETGVIVYALEFQAFHTRDKNGCAEVVDCRTTVRAEVK